MEHRGAGEGDLRKWLLYGRFRACLVGLGTSAQSRKKDSCPRAFRVSWYTGIGGVLRKTRVSSGKVTGMEVGERGRVPILLCCLFPLLFLSRGGRWPKPFCPDILKIVCFFCPFKSTVHRTGVHTCSCGASGQKRV